MSVSKFASVSITTSDGVFSAGAAGASAAGAAEAAAGAGGGGVAERGGIGALVPAL